LFTVWRIGEAAGVGRDKGKMLRGEENQSISEGCIMSPPNIEKVGSRVKRMEI
jgi:hypothetical protein